jgi:hypothetical protein
MGCSELGSWAGRRCAASAVPFLGAQRDRSKPTLNKRLSISVIFLIYIVVGIIIAVSKHYITIGVLKVIGSAVLAVFLWWLTLLGVNLHLH